MKKVFVITFLLMPIRLFAWTTPVNLSNTPKYSNYPHVTVDKWGKVHVVWAEDYHQSVSKIMYTCYESDTWSTPIDVSRNTQEVYLICPTVEVDSLSGRIHVMWTRSDCEIMWTYCDGDTWGVPVNISNTPGMATEPRPAIDKFGNLYVIWWSCYGGGIWYNMYDGISWQGSQRITDIIANTSDGSVDIVVDSQCCIHAVWTHHE